MAVSLGVQVSLLTHVSNDYDRHCFDGITLHDLGPRELPRFDNQYGPGGHRQQVLHAPGTSIPVRDITSLLEDDAHDAVFYAPAVRELLTVPRTALPRFFSLQGYFRTTDASNQIKADPNTWALLKTFLAPGDTTFFSVEDAGEPGLAQDTAMQLAHLGVSACITAGEQGAWVPRQAVTGCPYELIPAIPSDGVIDPTGAGDAFATAYCVRFLETGDARDATRFGLAAGSLAVERSGILSMPDRAAIETRAKQAGEG